MQDKTHSATLEVIYPDGRHMTAWLGATDVHSVNLPWQNTDDPQWHAQESGRPEERGDWLPYMTWTGSYSRSKPHCHYDVAPAGPGAGRYIWTEFEHRDLKTDDEDPDASHKKFKLFRDWNGANWKATVQNVEVIPGQPRFFLEKQ